MKNNDPKISVIIPTYNRAHSLPRAIKSVLMQTYKDFELIIVDDGSTDNTYEIVNKYIEKDDRVKYIKHEINKGGNKARNTGIKNALGNYITFLDSDDEYLSNNLEERFKIRQKISSDYGVIYNQNIKKTNLGEKIVPKRGIKKNESVIKYLFSNEGELQTNTLFISKDILIKNNLYFDENLKRHQDWDLAIRLQDVTSFYFLNKVLSIWNAKGEFNRVSKQKDYSTSFELIEKYKDKFNKEKGVLSKFYYKIGIWHLKISETKKARKLFFRSLKNKFYIRSLFLYISTFLGKKWIKFLFKLLDYKIKKAIKNEKY